MCTPATVSEGDQLQKIRHFVSLINKLGTVVLEPRCNAQAAELRPTLETFPLHFLPVMPNFL